MSARDTTKPPLVQALITSYFPVVESLSSASTSDLKSTIVLSSMHVSETPRSKIGNQNFYLGRLNTAEESPKRGCPKRLIIFDSPPSDSEPDVHSPPYSIASASSRM